MLVQARAGRLRFGAVDGSASGASRRVSGTFRVMTLLLLGTVTCGGRAHAVTEVMQAGAQISQ